MTRIHLATDIERFTWDLFDAPRPDTPQWRLREKLLTIVKRYRSVEYRVNKIRHEIEFYAGMAQWATYDYAAEIEQCNKLLDYIKEHAH